VSVAAKLIIFVNPSGQQTSAAAWLPAQLDLFVFGMALAVAQVWWSEHRDPPAVFDRRGMPGASWLVALALFWIVSVKIGLPRVPLYQQTLGQAFARQWLYGAFAFFLLLPAVFGPQDRGAVRALLRSRPMVTIGLVSYGVYLWHEAWILKILAWLHRPLFQVSFVGLTLAVGALTGACALASYALVERPAQRLGRRHRVPAPAAPSQPSLV
jgi:peptidoglycan/LPS O-acetylase OafA/YrhL